MLKLRKEEWHPAVDQLPMLQVEADDLVLATGGNKPVDWTKKLKYSLNSLL